MLSPVTRFYHAIKEVGNDLKSVQFLENARDLSKKPVC